MPRPWLLFLLVFAAWWPGSPWWQCDDFLMLEYTQDFGRAVSDFWGSHLGREGLVWFYRPLITLSFAVEQWVAGGPSPWVAHLSNVGVHAFNACLIGAIATRFLAARNGFLAGLLWGLMPAHAHAVAWAVGRVDIHATAWILLATLLSLRAMERRSRGNAALAVLCGALALCSKESAIVLPGVVGLTLFFAAPAGRRLRWGLRAWPFVVLVLLYLGLRHWALGRLVGGYDSVAFGVEESLLGLGSKTLAVLNPMRATHGEWMGLAPWLFWLGLLPALLAVILSSVRRRGVLLLGLSLAYLGLMLPTAQLWSQDDGMHALRYAYLPAAAIAMLFASGGWPTALLAAVVIVLPAAETQLDWRRQHQDSRAIHQLLMQANAELAPGTPLFVAGLPRSNRVGTTMAFRFAVDRLLEPPFVPAPGRDLYALRPLSLRVDPLRIPYGDRCGLPFDDAISLQLSPQGALSELPLADLPGLSLDLQVPDSIDPEAAMAIHRGELPGRIRIPGIRTPLYRVTLFTAGGYVTAMVPDRGAGLDGVVELRDLLHARDISEPGDDQQYVAYSLAAPIALDQDVAFPLLIEAGSLNPVSGEFEATHANRSMYRLRFERSYTDFMIGD